MVNSVEQLIRVTSWNVAGRVPLGDDLSLLFDDTKRAVNLKPHVHIVGLQEAPNYLLTVDYWTRPLNSTLRSRGYILFKRHKLSGILLYIFVLREMLLRTRDIETESVKTGFGGLWGNKGGVSLRFSLNGNSICATNSHLAAHQENLPQRISDYNSILDGTKFDVNNDTTTVLNHDYSFWFGDLNFRLDDIEKPDVLELITRARRAPNHEVRSKILSELHKKDQLNRSREKKLAFAEFNETLPIFLPTYKFQIDNNNVYDSENRIPAWTDRILYRYWPDSQNMNSANFKPKLDQLFYDSVPETNLSDHKPVVSLFRIATFDPTDPSSLPYEVIKFEPIEGWKAGQDGRVWYKINNELFYRRPKILSSFDKLALFRADFCCLEDYLAFNYVDNIARLSPTLNATEVPYMSSPSSSPALSRRGSTSSRGSNITVGTEAITIESNPLSTTNYTTPSESREHSRRPIVEVNAIPDYQIGDGFKYFSAIFSDEELSMPGKYVIIYLKQREADDCSVYGISEPFEIASS